MVLLPCSLDPHQGPCGAEGAASEESVLGRLAGRAGARAGVWRAQGSGHRMETSIALPTFS